MPAKKIVFLICLLFFSASVLFLTGYFIHKAQNLNIFEAVKIAWQPMINQYGEEIKDSTDLSIWWITPDDLNIINDHSSGVELHVQACQQDTESRVNFRGITQLLAPKIDKIMQQNDFKTNQLNSSTSIEDNRFYDYIKAYEKDNTQCVFVANPDCATLSQTQEPVHYTFSFGCTQNLAQNYDKQAPFLKDLGIKDAIIHVQKQTGNLVKLNVNYRRSGYNLIAKLVDNRWIELYSGQELPSCELTQENQIPQEISDCIKTQ